MSCCHFDYKCMSAPWMDLFGFGFVSSAPQHTFLCLQSPGLNSGTGKANVLPTCPGVSKVTESEESALGLWPESCGLAGAENRQALSQTYLT